EVINRDRADPTAAALRYGVDLNEGLAPGTISNADKQPLAVNPFLTDAARQHSQWMTDNDNFTHFEVDSSGNPISGFNQPQDRDITAGFNTPGGLSGYENIAAQSQNGPVPLLDSVNKENTSLFVDGNTPGRGHRVNVMRDILTEIGVGLAVGPLTY